MTDCQVIFLDRDGVINRDTGYVHRWEDFEFVPGAVEAMRRLCEAGIQIVVVTNQAGIARGMYTSHHFDKLTSSMESYLRENGVDLAAVYYCPHHPEGIVPEFTFSCGCRKPEPGMLLTASKELGFDLRSSILVGDKQSDIAAARSAGVSRAFLVGNACHSNLSQGAVPDDIFEDLAGCVEYLLTI